MTGGMTSSRRITMQGAVQAAAAADPDPRHARVPGEPRTLMLRDYLAPDGAVWVRRETEGYDDPAPGSLFVHPAWLRSCGDRDLVVVEAARPEDGAPRLVFARERGGLVHRGCLARLDAALVAGLGERLMRKSGAAFVVFEDVEIVSPASAPPRGLMFRYRNNWRLPLRDTSRLMSKQLVGNTRRAAQHLQRDVPGFSVAFEPAPDRVVMDTIARFGRIRIEGQGRPYLIDEPEVARLTAVAAEIGHGTRVRAGQGILAADLVCIVGDQAYLLTHGYDPGYPRSSLGMICLTHSIRACAERGLVAFNMMWGDLPYKGRLGGTCIPLQTVLLRRSAATLFHPGHIRMAVRFGWLDLKRRLKPYLAPHLARLRSRAIRERAGKT